MGRAIVIVPSNQGTSATPRRRKLTSNVNISEKGRKKFNVKKATQKATVNAKRVSKKIVKQRRVKVNRG